MIQKQKILVTGSNGQLGMELRDLSASYPQYEFLFTSRDEMPLDDFDAIKKIFAEYQPQYCINCAAYTKVDDAEKETEAAFRINGEAVGIIAAECVKYNTRLIHISTDYVFDGNAKTPYTEDSPVHPVNAYGASKLAGEEQLRSIATNAIIIRTSWVYSSYGKNFVKTMMRLMNIKEEISVVNDQIGSPTYAADLAEAIMQIVHGPWTIDHGQIFNFSNDSVISWYDFAVAIKELIHSNCTIHPIPTSQYPTPAKRPAYSVLDKTKIQQVFGVRLKNWKEGLALCIQKLH